MAYPDIYAVTYSYTGFQQSQGNNSFPGTQLDNDLRGLHDSINNVSTFMRGAFRSDGGLVAMPGSVPKASEAAAIAGVDDAAFMTPYLTAQAQLGKGSKPIVILASGQSNFVLTPAYSWTPNPNAKIWNNTINSDGSAGTAFVALSGAVINITHKIASDIAGANPTRPVFLIDVAFNARDISHWLAGATAPDVYQNILNNITAALAAAGVSKIDLFLWWQGEQDATPSPNPNYPANFETMMGRFWGNSWFPRETPVMIHGVQDGAGAGSPYYNTINTLLQGVVNADTDKRRFVYTADLPGATYWDATNPGHMTAQGYFSAGAMSARAFLNGPGRSSMRSITTDPNNGYMWFSPVGPGIASDPFSFVFNGQVVFPNNSNSVISYYGPNGGNLNTKDFTFGGARQDITARANGTYLAPAKLLADDIIKVWAGQGYDNVGEVAGNKVAIIGAALGAWDAPNHGTYLDFYTTAPGTDTTAAAVRILSGAIKINGTSSGSFTISVPAAAGAGSLDLSAAVTGPAAAVDSTPAVFDTTTGKLLKNITYAAFKALLALVKGDVGLGNVDNTSDATKNAAAVALTNKTSVGTTSLTLGSFTVATLPAGAAGMCVFCSNVRVFNGVGVQEGAAAGTGGLVTHNGTAWKIAGTNVTAVA